MFVNRDSGVLVPIAGTDPVLGDWTHQAFVPNPLPGGTPELSARTYLAVANARASIAALDSTAGRLENPTLLRLPTLQREAQSTSALEGTYAPLAAVYTADDESPESDEIAEVLNYVRMANRGFARIAEGQSLTPSLLAELQGMLMRGTPLEKQSGRLRDGQVVVGRRPDANPAGFAVHNARFVPPPPGIALEAAVRDLLDWIYSDHSGSIDPIVSAAMSHYQFETLHPFRDGNGRLGRYLIVLHLMSTGTLSEPTLTVSPWFEARRTEYYDRLLAVSTNGDWDGFVGFFAAGIHHAAERTRIQVLDLVAVEAELREELRRSSLRAESAHKLVSFAVATPSFTVRRVQDALGVGYVRANTLVGQLVELGILAAVPPGMYNRRFYAPRVMDVLSRDEA